MNNKAMMRTKPRYSFKELNNIHRNAMLHQHINYNFKNSFGEVRAASLNGPLMKSYQEHPERLEQAQLKVKKNFDTNVFGADYIVGYNIALEEESLDQDIIEQTDRRTASLSKAMSVIGVVFTSLIPALLNLMVICLFLINDTLAPYIGLALIVIVNLILAFVVRPRLFKGGIKDGASFGGKFSKKSQALFNMGLVLGSLTIGLSLAMVLQNTMTMDMFSTSNVTLMIIIAGAFIVFYFISKLEFMKKNYIVLLALIASIVLAFVI